MDGRSDFYDAKGRLLDEPDDLPEIPLSIADECRLIFQDQVDKGWRAYGGPLKEDLALDFFKETAEELCDALQYVVGARRKYKQLQQEHEALKAAAQAVVDRWHLYHDSNEPGRMDVDVSSTDLMLALEEALREQLGRAG